MACRIGINGFGRIGRMVLCRSVTLPEEELCKNGGEEHVEHPHGLLRLLRQGCF